MNEELESISGNEYIEDAGEGVASGAHANPAELQTDVSGNDVVVSDSVSGNDVIINDTQSEVIIEYYEKVHIELQKLNYTATAILFFIIFTWIYQKLHNIVKKAVPKNE